MIYTRTIYFGDYSIDETFEGEPEEILVLLSELDDEAELVYDQEEAIEFIKQDRRTSVLSESAIRRVLDVDEDYMQSKGIIDD